MGFLVIMKTNETKLQEALKKKEDNHAKIKRHIQMGYVKGRIFPNGGMIVYETPKKIQHWHDTRTLINLVSEAFVRNEIWSGKRQCFINGKWQLQIRGKHLRRLLKARPDWKCTGRMIVEK